MQNDPVPIQQPCEAELRGGAFPSWSLGTRLVVLALILVSCLAGTSYSQTKSGATLMARMEPRTRTLRPRTPAPLVWYLRWNGIELLEGYLDISVYDGRQKIGQMRSDEIVLSTGERQIEMRLPILMADDVHTQAMLHAEFVTEKRRYDLKEFPLRLPEYGTRTMTVGVCNPWEQRISPRQSRLIHSLRLDRFKKRVDDRSLTTSFGHIRPTEVPADALGFCGYNLMVLMDEGFSELRPGQLDALYRWVSAGGSVCVMPGSGLSAAHVEFLNRLAARDPQAEPFLANDRGELVIEGAADQQDIRLLQPGVGRAAIVLSASDTARNPDTDDWETMVADLWFVQKRHVPQLVRNGNWEGIDIGRPGEVIHGVARDDVLKFEYKPISQGNWLLDRLMPETVEVVPLWVIGLILAGYVVLIGPVDYFALGAIKQRRMTWLLFPLVTVGVTSFTVWLSKWYMQPSGDPRRVEFLDVGDDNRIARRSRFELLFLGNQMKVERQLAGEVFAALNKDRFSARGQQMYAQYNGRMRNYREPEQLVGIADYEGRIPSSYAVSQNIPQWSPQINRFFSIRKPAADKGVEAEFDWDSLQPPAEFARADAELSTQWKDSVRQRVQQQFGSGASIWVMSETKVEQIAGNRGLFAYRQYASDYYDVGVYVDEAGGVVDEAGGVVDEAGGVSPDPSEVGAHFLTQTCRRPNVGLYSLISRIAPTGGDSFEDLAILDRTDPHQVLLVVAVEDTGDLRIFRKLFVLE